MAATVLDSPRPGRDSSKTVQLVFPIGDDGVFIEQPSASSLHKPLKPQRKPRTQKASGRAAPINVEIEEQRVTTRDVPVPSRLTTLPVPMDPGLATELPRIGDATRSDSCPQAQELSIHLGEQQPRAGMCSSATANVLAPPMPIEEADLRGLKQKVQKLPRHHPLRVALKGEPDRMPRSELVLKLMEWAKYLAWQER